MTTATEPQTAQTTQVYQLFIKASQQEIWEALVRPDIVRQYFHGAELESELVAGGRRVTWSPDRTKLWGDTAVLEFDPPRKLVHGWHSGYDEELAAEPESRVAWEIEPHEGGYCRLTVIHDRLEGAPRTAASVAGAGWMFVLSALKTLLETGAPIDA